MDTGIAVRVDDNGALSVTASDEYRQVRQKHGDPDRLLNADSDEFFGTCATTESHEFFGQEEQ
jgi:hypothetical protein